MMTWSGSIATEMITGNSGATAMGKNIIESFYTTIMNILTPADEGNDDKISNGDSDKNEDQFLEHEHSLCSHPHDRGQSKVVDEHRHSHTSSFH